MRRNTPRWAPVLLSETSGDVTMTLKAAIEITCHDHSTTAWVGRSYILLRYLVFVFVVRFLFIRWFPCIQHSIIFWGFPYVMVCVPLQLLGFACIKICLLCNIKGSGYRTVTSHAFRIKCWVCHFNGHVADAFTSAMWMVFSVALTLGTFILVVVVALYFLQNFPNFCVRIYGLGFRFKGYVWGLQIRFRG